MNLYYLMSAGGYDLSMESQKQFKKAITKNKVHTFSKKTEKILNTLLKSPYSISFGFISPETLPVPNPVLYTYIGSLFMNDFNDSNDIDDD